MGHTLMMPGPGAGRVAGQCPPPLRLANPWRPWREQLPVALRIAQPAPPGAPVEDALRDQEDPERWDGMG